MISIEKLREPKIWNMAIFDLSAVFIVVFVIHMIMWRNYKGVNADKRTVPQYIISLLFMFFTFVGLGVVFHSIFRIESGLSYYLGFNDKPIRK